MLAASPSVPNLEKYVLLPKYWQLPEFYGFHSDILSYLPPHEHAEVMVNVVASIFWNLLGEWNKARLSDSVEPHHRVFHQIVNRGELFLLSKCAIFALILQGRMLQRKTAPIKDLRNYTRLTEDIFSSRRIGHLELPGCEDPEAWEIVSKYPHAKRLNLSRASNVRSHCFLVERGKLLPKSARTRSFFLRTSRGRYGDPYSGCEMPAASDSHFEQFRTAIRGGTPNGDPMLFPFGTSGFESMQCISAGARLRLVYFRNSSGDRRALPRHAGASPSF